MARSDFSIDELRIYRPDVLEPADFDSFWDRTLQEARDHTTAPVVMTAEPILSAVEARDVRFPGFAGQMIAAWLISPRAGQLQRGGIVQFVAYGGGRGLAHEHLAWASAGYVTLVVDVRGQGSGWSIGVTPDDYGSGPASPGVMTRGISSPDTYYYRRLITDAVRAVEALRGMDIVDEARIAVTGMSQGGGLALAVAGLTDVAALMADVPFLCHFERAVGLTDANPYAEIRDYLRVHRHAVEATFSTLAYFDGVNFAKRATAPALFSVALEDDITPPSTVFAATNHYAGNAEVDVYPYNGHEGGGPQRWPRQMRWMSSTLPTRG